MPSILIVDDSADARYLLRTILAGAGYTTQEASNGAEALDLVRSRQVDAVISDGLMPVMDGFRLCLEMKRDEELASVPFVFYTASFTHPDDLQLATTMGADAYLLKPAEPSELLGTIKKVLATGSAEPKDSPGDAELAALLDGYGRRIESKLDQKVADLQEARSLRDSYRSLLQHMPVLVMTLDNRGVADFVNDAALAFIGVSDPRAFIGAIHPQDLQPFETQIQSLLASPRRAKTTVRLRDKRDEYRTIEVTVEPYSGGDDDFLGFVLTGVDITRQEQHRELLMQANEIDPLTELPTRHVFDRRFDEILRNVGKGATCALLLITSPDVKAINDRYGFDVGDATLANLAHAIEGSVRPADLVARLCSTEFAVIAEGLGWDEAGVLVDRIKDRVASASLVPGDHTRRISVDIGLNVIPEVPLASDGKQSVEPVLPDVRGAASDLQRALQGEVHLAFRPVYSLLDGRLARCSVRYSYQLDEHVISGDELWLGAAKQGIARRVETNALETALELAAAHGVPCSVPLSIAGVLDSTIFKRLELAADRIGVRPEHLIFEVDEQALPSMHWLHAAARSPIRLINNWTDLNAADSWADLLRVEAELELSASSLFDAHGSANPVAAERISQWRASRLSVTINDVEDIAFLPTLRGLGATHASGTALAGILDDLRQVPRSVKVG